MKLFLIYMLLAPTLSYAAAEKLSGMLLYTDKHEQLIVRDLSSGKESKLKTAARFPRWSPNGEKILFYSFGPNQRNEGIYLIDKSGRNKKKITQNPPETHARYPEWSGNGEIIYYNLHSYGKNVVQQLKLTQPKDPITVNLQKYLGESSQKGVDEQRFYPSYDSRFALLASTHPYELQLINLQKEAVVAKISFPDGFSDAGWSKDSKRVAIGTGSFDETRMVIINVDGSYEVVAYQKPEELGCGGYSWSKDARYIAMDCREPYCENCDGWIFVYDVEKKQNKRLLKGADSDWY